jgi:phycobilisome rod-core linker protein
MFEFTNFLKLMTIPPLTYRPSSQNQRVQGFEVPGDEAPRIYSTDNLLDPAEMEQLIQATYRQIFHEQQMLKHHFQIQLESQLRSNQITVKDFVRSLVLSGSFRRLNYDANNNYRFVELLVQRLLGRQVYNHRETLCWSIVLSTEGLIGLVDRLMNSDEYLENFGENDVPYQRRRILPQRERGEVSFAHMARYGTDYRDKLPQPNLRALMGPGFTGPLMSSPRWSWQKNPPKVLTQIWLGLFFGGLSFIAILGLIVLTGF